MIITHQLCDCIPTDSPHGGHVLLHQRQVNEMVPKAPLLLLQEERLVPALNGANGGLQVPEGNKKKEKNVAEKDV